MEQSVIQHHWWEFVELVAPASLPQVFPYPFHHEPHPVSQAAAHQLQDYLRNRTDWTDLHHSEVGKMFGVLVVERKDGEIGFLAAFSGKIGDRSTIPPFVPPFYDRHDPQGFFRVGEKELNTINQRIDNLLQSETYLKALEEKKAFQQQAEAEITELKAANKEAKRQREEQRTAAAESMRLQDRQILEEKLQRQSIHRHYLLKDLKRQWKQRLADRQQNWHRMEEELVQLRKARKEKSAALQQRLFEQYAFLNSSGASKNVQEVFAETVFKVPPAGAGDCAAPKLLQFAFQHGLRPVAMAEFWWGPSPKSEIRKHGQFYPACRGKCEPILGHMLRGIDVQENPLAKDRLQVDQLEIVYEDDHLLAINKPAGFLSVPGKTWSDSVLLRMRQQYPEATGPLVVHRLDMSTSGLMLIAKDKDVHKELQHQFLKRTVKKRYVAVLNGELGMEQGTIDLPLRVDLEDRPRQLVCYEHGKSARTQFEVLERKNGKTRIHFFPITGRTHQLRVHAAHPAGLNLPIVGDELYGTAADRLYLHAEEIEFVHPTSGQQMKIVRTADF